MLKALHRLPNQKRKGDKNYGKQGNHQENRGAERARSPYGRGKGRSRSNQRQHQGKVFNNYKGKKVYNVRIRFINKLLEQVYDEFGRDIVFIRDDDGKHFMITQPISVSPTFYAWIATFGHKVKILYPPEVIDGMRKFLQDAADMYKNDGEM